MIVLERVVSGGQVGADIAGLRAAQRLGLRTGGYMPKGWKTITLPRPEYGRLYDMTECEQGGYPTRTHYNVQEGDATLCFARDWSAAGERLTIDLCEKEERPLKRVTINPDGLMWPAPSKVRAWLEALQVRTLNVAGNADATIEKLVEGYLVEVLSGAG